MKIEKEYRNIRKRFLYRSLEEKSDFSKFYNRLWTLMENSGDDTPKKLAAALYKEDLVHVNQNDQIDADEKDSYIQQEKRKNAIGSIEKKIIKHLNSEDTDKLQGEFVRAYCKHFNCSADFLFGNTDIKTNQIDVRNVCEATGLSETAVSYLVEIKNTSENSTTKLNFWSSLIEVIRDEIVDGMYKVFQKQIYCIKPMIKQSAIEYLLKEEEKGTPKYEYLAQELRETEEELQNGMLILIALLDNISHGITNKMGDFVMGDMFNEYIASNESEYNSLYNDYIQHYSEQLCKLS